MVIDDGAKVFRPAGEPWRGDDSAVTPVERVPVRVAEVTAEWDDEELPEVPLHLLPRPGALAVQLRSTLRRVAVGAGLARRADLLDAVRQLPGVPPVVTSPAGGTFVVGGRPWLGVAAIGRPAADGALPVDWALHAFHDWLRARLAPAGIVLHRGQVDGAWCPGFSDLSAGGRKLVGLGFRATRDWVAVRGMLAVGRAPDEDIALLDAVHCLIGRSVRREACTSLAELTGDDSWLVGRAVELLAAGDEPVVRRRDGASAA